MTKGKTDASWPGRDDRPDTSRPFGRIVRKIVQQPSIGARSYNFRIDEFNAELTAHYTILLHRRKSQ